MPNGSKAHDSTIIKVTVKPALLKSLRGFCDVTGLPLATAVTHLLNEMRPQLDALTEITALANAGRHKAAKRAIANMVGDSVAQVMRVGSSK
jgi:hypothetical protein